MAQGQGDLLVRAVRGAPAVWGVEEWGGGGWVRQQQRATAARPLGIAAVRLRIRLAFGGRLGAAASGVLRRPSRRGGPGLVLSNKRVERDSHTSPPFKLKLIISTVSCVRRGQQ
jgi:hypothetical protein